LLIGGFAASRSVGDAPTLSNVGEMRRRYSGALGQTERHDYAALERFTRE